MDTERPAVPAARHHDFLKLLPHRVVPTGGIWVLAQSGHILFIKSYRHADPISRAQRRIWKTLQKFGEPETASGTVTVFCVWGLGKDTVRNVTVFDHMGETEHTDLPLSEWRQMLLDWWNDCSRLG